MGVLRAPGDWTGLSQFWQKCQHTVDLFKQESISPAAKASVRELENAIERAGRLPDDHARRSAVDSAGTTSRRNFHFIA
jgi:hypothetical protein